MKINCYEFKIGSDVGYYPPGQIITDSILNRVCIAYVMVDSVINKSDFDHQIDKGTLIFPLPITLSGNAIVTIIFKSPIEF